MQADYVKTMLNDELDRLYQRVVEVKASKPMHVDAEISEHGTTAFILTLLGEVASINLKVEELRKYTNSLTEAMALLVARLEGKDEYN